MEWLFPILFLVSFLIISLLKINSNNKQRDSGGVIAIALSIVFIITVGIVAFM
ncbi:hypothetical protein ACFFGV_05440 [Pontibacillus salicampi]|uniref:Uncharacterized protein n=1 Tax=Pontibacillus salicampi TaxID=1449801 RepID=A0ABV6LL51_9BACI